MEGRKTWLIANVALVLALVVAVALAVDGGFALFESDIDSK